MPPLSKMMPLRALCLHFMTFLCFRSREFGAAEQGEPGQEAEGLPVGPQFGTDQEQVEPRVPAQSRDAEFNGQRK